MKLADIPNRGIRPVDAEPSKMRELLRSQVIRRRGILKGMAGAAMVLGISALDLLPGRNNANAVIRDASSKWRFWDQCTDYSADAWRTCNPTVAKVSEGYCQPANLARHREDYVEIDSCHWTDYQYDARCGTYNGTHVNAWRWHKSEGDPNTGPASVVCSDGKVYYQSHPTCVTKNYKSTCRHYL